MTEETEEIPLAGGDINVVVRVGGTVRRPQGPWSPAVHALLEWYERVGFDGAPRFLGVDEQGREILSFVEGEPAFAPVPGADEVLPALGALLRRLHDAQAGFVPPTSAQWQWNVCAPESVEVIGHLDLFWTNVIFRGGMPAALIDWDFAAPATRVLEVALAASYWAPLRADEIVREWGLPLDWCGERVRLLCDGYGLDRKQRSELLGALSTHWQRGVGNFVAGAPARRAANLRWLEEHRPDLDRFLA